MLTVYRRHRASCKHRSRRFKGCFCPIWAQGVLRGEKIRRSLDLTNWEAAQKLVREWEIHSPELSMTVNQAAERFVEDNEARKLTDRQLRKYKTVVEEVKQRFGEIPIRSLTVDDVRKIREGWRLAPITMQKRLEMLRSFFRFCMDSGWTDKNPARSIKLPVAKFKPTMPFTDADMEKILWAADTIREIHPKMRPGIEKKVKALILLMRYSGIRISDAVGLKPERIDKKGRLFLYQAKTGHPVQIPLGPNVLSALKACEDVYYFYSGVGTLKTQVTDYQSVLKKVFAIAGIDDGHSHRLRDTFSVDLLTKGVSLQTVSILLGHRSIRTTEKHYAPFVKATSDALEIAVKKTWV
jgi:site-specific recombinase XerD